VLLFDNPPVPAEAIEFANPAGGARPQIADFPPIVLLKEMAALQIVVQGHARYLAIARPRN
jgi:hypothetical protein